MLTRVRPPGQFFLTHAVRVRPPGPFREFLNLALNGGLEITQAEVVREHAEQDGANEQDSGNSVLASVTGGQVIAVRTRTTPGPGAVASGTFAESLLRICAST